MCLPSVHPLLVQSVLHLLVSLLQLPKCRTCNYGARSPPSVVRSTLLSGHMHGALRRA